MISSFSNLLCFYCCRIMTRLKNCYSTVAYVKATKHPGRITVASVDGNHRGVFLYIMHIFTF